MARAITSAFLTLALAACNSGSVGLEGTPCATDADCPTEEHCDTAPTNFRPRIALPCPAGHTVCTADPDCPSGQVCEKITHDGKSDCGKACTLGCPSIPCGMYQSCENSRCRLLGCNEVGGQACPEHWRCDPAGAAAEPLVNEGSREEDQNWLIAIGCVRLRCDETGGFTCKDLAAGGWVCDPENATDGSGCVALRCEISGACSSPDMICTITSGNRRPSGEDPHGCVPRNCEEGAPCPLTNPQSGRTVGYCDFSAADSGPTGCAIDPCESDAECPPHEICDPGSTDANIYGCRQRKCTEGYSCDAGYHCNPSSSWASNSGCVSVDLDGTPGATGRCTAD